MQTDDCRGPFQEACERRIVLRGTDAVVGPGHSEDRRLLHIRPDCADLACRPLPVEAEAPGRAEELRAVGDREHALHADAESSDLAAPLVGHSHTQDGLDAACREGTAFVGDVEVTARQEDVHLAARLVAQFVCAVLDQLEDLSGAVSALEDPSLTVRMFENQAGVDPVGLKDPPGLLDDCFQHSLRFRRRLRSRHGVTP